MDARDLATWNLYRYDSEEIAFCAKIGEVRALICLGAKKKDVQKLASEIREWIDTTYKQECNKASAGWKGDGRVAVAGMGAAVKSWQRRTHCVDYLVDTTME